MPYVTHVQLAERPGARELAQVASDEHRPVVDSALMELTLTGGDRSEYDAEDIAAADDALARIDEAIADADGLIDGYLAKRGYTLPLNPVHRLVTTWSRDITRYLLHKDRLTAESNDPIYRNYKDAIRSLEKVAAGTLSLGDGDDQNTAGIGEPEFTCGMSTFRDAMRDY
jgi:phage gp36-like protein